VRQRLPTWRQLRRTAFFTEELLMHSLRVFTSLAAASLLLLTPCSEAQRQASCTFKFFVPPAPYNASFDATGINQSNTVVGTASTTKHRTATVEGFHSLPWRPHLVVCRPQSQHHGPE
jgi:hypothetical protein